MASRGVALIVVHGVADQKSGETAQAVVELMVAAELHKLRRADELPARYAAAAREDFVVTVDPLVPLRAAPRSAEATPRSEDRSLAKAWSQSLRSDFQRHGWATEGASPVFDGAGDANADRGIAATDYLLAKHSDNGAAAEAYATSCIRLERSTAAGTTPIAVYEMYWADLSRLSGALPRIVTELFTMVFRLSKLGRDTVDEARHALRNAPGSTPLQRRAWDWANGSQILLDWLFANGLALLFAQLFLLAQIFAVLGLLRLVDVHLVHGVVASAVAIVALFVYAYQRRGALVEPARWAPPVLVAVACLGALWVPALRPWVSGLLLIGAITFVYELVLRVADDRFPFVRLAGRILWLTLLAVMAASAVHEIARVGFALDPDRLDVGWHAAVFGVEVTLWAIKWWWIGAGGLLMIWFFAGMTAAWCGGYEAKASIATGRLGLALSLAAFLTMTMAIWTLLSTTLELAAQDIKYSPCIFAFDEAAELALDGKNHPPPTCPLGCTEPVKPRPGKTFAPIVNLCLWRTDASLGNALSPAAPSASSAALFLRQRHRNSTEAFSLVAALLLALIAFLVVTFTPSVLAEMKLLVGRGRDRAKKAVDEKKAA